MHVTGYSLFKDAICDSNNIKGGENYRVKLLHTIETKSVSI